MNDEQQHLINLAWKILYKEERESIPDPNKPENVPHHKAKKKKRADEFRRLLEGPGKVLFETWYEKLKGMNLTMLFIPDKDLCNCPACNAIKQMKVILQLWLEAEQALFESKQIKEM